MAQYVYSMFRVSKKVPPNRQIIKDISLSFLPGAKIGILGLNGAGKSTVLRIMAGLDTEIEGDAQPMPGISDRVSCRKSRSSIPTKTVRETVEEALTELTAARTRLDAVYAAYGEPDADFEKLAEEQAKLEAMLFAQGGDDVEQQLEVAADALRLPPWDARSRRSRAVRSGASRFAGCCFRNPTCCCSTSRRTISTRRASSGSNSFCSVSRAPSSR